MGDIEHSESSRVDGRVFDIRGAQQPTHQYRVVSEEREGSAQWARLKDLQTLDSARLREQNERWRWQLGLER